jgi:hypothetical protein
MTTRRLLVLAGGLALAACSGSDADDDDDDTSEASYCGTLVSRLRECDVIGAGRLGCTNYEDKAEVCETECLRQGTCGALVDFYCAFEGAVARCFSECIGIKPFSCADGVVLDSIAVCNGNEDCSGGEDELECTLTGRYKCRNVDTRIDFSLVCDGVEDCSDGSDELPDCEIALVCDGGLELSESQICNGVAICSDGSDEPSDCAVATCG